MMFSLEAGMARQAFFWLAALPSSRSLIHNRGNQAFLALYSHNSFCTLPDNQLTLQRQLEMFNISLTSFNGGNFIKGLCPKCKGGASGKKTLAVNVSHNGGFAKWACSRTNCLYNGQMESKLTAHAVPEDKYENNVQGSDEGQKANALTNAVPDHSDSEKGRVGTISTRRNLRDPDDVVLYYFEKRRISKQTLIRNGVKETSSAQHGVVIAFPYRMNQEVINCKYRTMGKTFWQEKQSLKVFYGLDDIKSKNEIIIVEGEIDKLSLEEAGFLNCVSVPDGAPPKVSPKGPPPEEEDKKFSYIWNCKDYFKEAARIILATDADPPGQALAEELARRLGRERCWRVEWPKKDGKTLKDANEVLVELGPKELKAAIDNARLYPIRGLFSFMDFFKELDDYFRIPGTEEIGASTGWHTLDDFYKVVPGELTLVTGVPGSGKSEWIDALLCNLNQNKGWTFALCSMENKVRDHGRKLLEKYFRKPFFNAIYSGNKERISPEELELGKQWMNENFYLIRCEDNELPSVDWLLNLAKAAVLRHGIRGLVIDPYNELDHQRGAEQTETEYVSKILTRIKRFAQYHGCHVWFVAHPKQIQFWQGDAPNLYDISGSAHFVNKCDNGIVIHRNRDPTKGPLDRVQVIVKKARNKVSGSLGEVSLTYDRVTGIYSDVK